MTFAPSSPASPEPRCLPEAFVQMLLSRPQGRALVEALSMSEPEVSVRIAAHRGLGMPQLVDTAPWNARLAYLSGRPRFTFDPSLHQGLYYVQDASSAALPTVLRHALIQADINPDGKLRVLDACAAPGGKTTAVADALGSESTGVVATEYDRTRAGVLVENLQRWGDPRIIATCADAASFGVLHDAFDVICADVPCSGEGMMRKDRDAVAQWSPALVRDCAALQRRILLGLWDALRPGGVLIYSTCTFNTAEDEDNVRYVIDELGATPLSTGLENMPGVSPGCFDEGLMPFPCTHFYPGIARGEGLFVAALRKDGDSVPMVQDDDMRRPKSFKRKSAAKTQPIPEAVRRMVRGDMSWSTDAAGIITAAPPAVAAMAARLADAGLRVILEGVEVGTIKGRDVIPAHALAMSQVVDCDAFVKAPIDWREAVSYLQRNAPILPEDTPRGIVLLTYQGRPLGFAKNLGNRANTLLPANRRIISPHVPDAPENVLAAVGVMPAGDE